MTELFPTVVEHYHGYMIIDNAVPRVSQALADYANDVKLTGSSTWDPSDFGDAAQRFVKTAVQLATTSKSEDMRMLLCVHLTGWEFDVSNTRHEGAIDAALFEIGEDMFPGVEL